jgi:hypothetical protein
MTDFDAHADELTDDAPNADEWLLIVVGTHPEAERSHRPLAYRLRERVLRWIDQQREGEIDRPRSPLVLSDVWYLNARELQSTPTIAIGEAGVNAATAYFAHRLPTAFVIDGAFRVQLDPEFIDPKACIWGASPAATASGIDLFVERYLDDFLRAAHDLPI